MNRITAIVTGTAVASVLWFQQQEIQTVHEEVQEIRSLIVQTHQRVDYSAQDLQCLAKNIYHEAGIESREGKFAVAQVTLNRLRAGRWGNSICSVVYARAQFSWTLNQKVRAEQPRGPLWEQSQTVAQAVLEQGYRVPDLESAVMYHADYVKPYWVKSVSRIQQIGRHIFYSIT
jgi:spore germination cell wall hydrolase CwlJ-like protein